MTDCRTRILNRVAGVAFAAALAIGGVACSDDNGSAEGDPAPGEDVSDLACLNAFEAVRAGEAELSSTLEACESRDVWESVAADFEDVLDGDAATTLDDLCLEAGDEALACS